MSQATGTVSLVGAGPGDPQLLTVKGQQLLRHADVVVYDHLVSPRLLTLCRPTAKLVYVGKESDQRDASQGTINRVLIQHAKAGRRVVRLKGGDPFLFGRGGEEALALAKARVRYEIVPGVTSALAVPAYAGIPVTHRGLSSSVGIITGHEDPAKGRSAIQWERLVGCDTLVCLMAVRTLPVLTQRLIQHGRSPNTPCAVIEWGTYPRQRTITGRLRTIVAQAKRARVEPPAVLIVGDVVGLRSRLQWFENRPLFGKRILVTRAPSKSAPLTDALESLGAQVDELPAIEQVAVRTNGLFAQAIRQIPDTDWVFFTSPEGISWFSRLLKPLRKDVRWLSGCHIAAIGPKTAESIEALGVHVDFVPKQYSQEGLLHDLPARLLRGKRGLIFSAEDSRDALVSGLRQRGMQVRNIPVYRTTMPAGLRASVAGLLRERCDFVTVTSASCVDHLYQALQAAGQQRRFRTLRFASIGPITSRAVRARGGIVAVEASVSTVEGLVNAMLKHR